MKKEKNEFWEIEKRELLEKMIEKISSFTFSSNNPSREVQGQK